MLKSLINYDRYDLCLSGYIILSGTRFQTIIGISVHAFFVSRINFAKVLVIFPEHYTIQIESGILVEELHQCDLHL